MKGRRKARSLALQVLYELDCTDHPVDEVFAYRLSEVKLGDSLTAFARQLVAGTLDHCDSLDEMIHRHAPEWPLDQMALVDRNVLRMAIWEFAIDQTTPTKVAINEAVELAKLFGSDAAPRFVNGVLGTLAAKENDIRQALAARNARK